MLKKLMNCPNECGEIRVNQLDKNMKFRGVDINYQVEHYLCPECGIEVGTIDQAAVTQRAIADAYREKVGLLSGREIRQERKREGLTQKKLAEQMNVGIASIKRWEGGQIQSKSMDKALKLALEGQPMGNSCTGNRKLSIPRIKTVLRGFEKELEREVLIKNDHMLYAGKYLWYADMVAFRELGSSMTGTPYAALLQGPQLNNYLDLYDIIYNTEENDDERLEVEEERIIRRISRCFPTDSSVYRATHRELICKNKTIGEPIPYSDSAQLTEI